MAPRRSIPRAFVLLGIITTMLMGLVLAPAAYADPINSAPILNPPVPGDGTVTLSFGDPLDPAIESYQYTVYDDEDHWVDFPTKTDADGNFTVLIKGLTNGTQYPARVRGTNATDGGGPSSDPVQVIPGRPAAPVLSPTATDGGAVITFPVPASGGFKFKSPNPYTTTVTPDEPGTTVNYEPGADQVTVTLDGLTNQTPYDVSIVAANEKGPGVPATTTVTPDATPPAPDNVVATAGNGRSFISFDPSEVPNGGSAVTSYTVTEVNDPNLTATCDGVSECAVTGLTNGTEYTFAVVAANNSFMSEPGLSNPVIPKGPPLAPRSPVVVRSTASSLTVSFLPAYAAGSSVLGYAISSDGGKTFRGASVKTSGSRRVVSAVGLASGTYYRLAVLARNAEGLGPSSAIVTGQTAPRAVQGRPSVQVGVTMARVSWRVSRDAATTGYTVYARPGGGCTTYSRYSTSCLVGAVTGTRTTFVVVARDAGGRSVPSLASAAVRTRAVPVPTRLPGVPGGLSTGRTTKVKSGRHFTVSGRGFLPGSLVTLVAYRSKRVIMGYTVAVAGGSIKKSVRMPRGGKGRVTLVAFGVTPGGTGKAMSKSLTRTR